MSRSDHGDDMKTDQRSINNYGAKVERYWRWTLDWLLIAALSLLAGSVCGVAILLLEYYSLRDDWD
jgi:hypothetical protein